MANMGSQLLETADAWDASEAFGQSFDLRAEQHRIPHGHPRDTVLLSTDSEGSELNLGSFNPSVTNDGRYASFITYGDFQIHLKYLKTGELALVSSDAHGNPANGPSGAISDVFKGSHGHISIAFDSSASNLVPGDTNGHTDVFIKDVETGAVALVSTASHGQHGNGDSGAADVSEDGRYVAFESSAGNFLPQSAGPPRQFSLTKDIYVKDLDNGHLTLISANVLGHQATGPESAYFGTSGSPSISAHGTKVAFTSYGTNLVDGDLNEQPDVFVKDVRSGAVTLASSDNEGHQSDGSSGSAAISANGRYVAFYSNATNLAAEGTNNTFEVYLKDLATGHLSLVSANAQGHPANDFSGAPAISPNGRYVAFESDATNLASGTSSNQFNVYVRDMLTGGLELISSDHSGSPTGGSEAKVTNAGAVVFASQFDDPAAGDMNGMFDIFLSSLEHGRDLWD